MQTNNIAPNSINKNRCLIVDDDPGISELIGGLIESEYDLQCDLASSGNQAIFLIKKQMTDYLFIVSNFQMPNGNGADVLKYLNTKQAATPFIFCSDEKPNGFEDDFEKGIVSFVEKPFFLLSLKNEIEKILMNSHYFSHQFLYENKIGDNPDVINNNDKDYAKIRKKLIFNLTIAPCNIYIKLGSNRYILFFRSEAYLRTSDIQRIFDKKIDCVYILKKDLNQFYETLIAKCSLEQRSGAKEQNPFVNYLSDIQSHCHDLFSEMGFNSDFEQLIVKNIKVVLDLISNNQYLDSILQNLANSERYIPGHSILICFVSSWISTKIEWGSQKNMDTLTFASLLHDITLNNDMLAKIRNEAELIEKKALFTHDEIQAWKRHSDDAAKLTTLFKETPSGVDGIILQHHKYYELFANEETGSKNRIMFSPLSALFIISHELTDYILNEELKCITPEHLKLCFQDKFIVEPFKQIVSSLLKRVDNISSRQS